MAPPSDDRVLNSAHSIDLSIDQLVLDGFSGIDRDELAAAIQTELSRVLAERGLPRVPPSGANSLPPHVQVTAGASSLSADLNVGSIAGQLAETIYGRLRQ